MNTIIRQKRKELGMTQKQVADYLGVSSPAVNKWEMGTSCPDISLLPAIARLLKIDMNELFSFEKQLTQLEISQFLALISDTFRDSGFEKAFEVAMEKINEFPQDMELIHSVALVLQGCLLMSGLTVEEKINREQKITELYERVAKSENEKFAKEARYMLISKCIRDDKMEQAQEYLEKMPEYSPLDKRCLQADIWMKEGKIKEAAQVYERKIVENVQRILIDLTNLVNISMKENDSRTAEELAFCGSEMIRIFGMWEYSSYIVPMELAGIRKDKDQMISILTNLLSALLVPWDTSKCPVYRHLNVLIEERNQKGVSQKDNHRKRSVMESNMLVPIIQELENSESYDFLRDDPRFHELINECKRNLEKSDMRTSKVLK